MWKYTNFGENYFLTKEDLFLLNTNEQIPCMDTELTTEQYLSMVFTSRLGDKIMANCQNSYTVRVRNAELQKERHSYIFI